MSKSRVAHKLLYPSMAGLLAHHQVLSYGSLSRKARLSHKKQESGFMEL